MAAEIEQLFKLAVGRVCFQILLSFNLKILDTLPQSFVFGLESRQSVVIFTKVYNPVNGTLRGNLERPHNPHQQRAEGFIFQLAARRSHQNINRQKETKTSA